MKLNSIYVAAADMNRAVDFYKGLFQAEPARQSDRFSAFQLGDVLFGLMNKEAYAFPLKVGNNCVPTFEVNDIDSEFGRIKNISPSRITDEVASVGPYRLFQLADTEGNALEIYSAR